MPWVAVLPKHSRNRVDRAGIAIVDPNTDILSYHSSLEVVNNWRTAHSWPLNTFQTTLRSRAKAIDDKVLIAQRLKRLASIEAKLRRFPNMKLSQMQDLGGCRAVLRRAENVYALVQRYMDSGSKNPHRHEFVDGDDYIGSPKDDGYRGIHLVYKYKTTVDKYIPFNGLRIEIQLRSQLQHAWAMAVETVDTFTKQALKSSAGDERWARFFALISSAIALREKMPPVPGTPTSQRQLKRELRAIEKELKVRARLLSWQVALQHVGITTEEADAYLVVFDIDAWMVKATGFDAADLEEATNQYLDLERRIAQGANMQVVLVGVESIDALRKAYPSYFVDSTAFIKALDHAVI